MTCYTLTGKIFEESEVSLMIAMKKELVMDNYMLTSVSHH